MNELLTRKVMCLILFVFVSNLLFSSCPEAPVEIEKCNGSDWVSVGQALSKEKWGAIFSDIRKRSKAYFSDGFCCKGLANNESIRVIYPMCDYYYYLTNASKAGKSKEYTLYWTVHIGHEENKTMQAMVPADIAKRINSLLFNKRGDLKLLPSLGMPESK